jgi:hypothetical protein
MKRALAALILLCASSASAERLTAEITDVTPILNESSEGRILLRWDLPNLAQNVAIRRAILVFDIPGGGDEKHLSLRIHPVTTSWNPVTVDWTTGWTRPGGDFPEDLFARGEIDVGRGAGSAAIDLTPLVKEILEDGFVADGLIITLDPNEGEAIRSADLPRFASLGSGRLEVSSRSVPLIPREVIETRGQVR